MYVMCPSFAGMNLFVPGQCYTGIVAVQLRGLYIGDDIYPSLSQLLTPTNHPRRNHVSKATLDELRGRWE